MSIQDIENLVRDFVRVVKGRTRLFMLELNLAKFSFMPFIWLLISFAILSSITWLIFLGILGYGIFWMTQSVIISLVGIFCINIVIAGVVLSYLTYFLKQMQFQRTRKYFNRAKSQGEDNAKIMPTPAEH